MLFRSSKFTHVKPLKRGGNRRYYRPEDVELLKAIQHLLYTEGYTIRGVQKLLKEQGVRAMVEGVMSGEAPAAVGGNGVSQSAENGTDMAVILSELKEIRNILKG